MNLRWMVFGVLGLGVLLFALTQWPTGDRTSPEAETDAAAGDQDEAEPEEDEAEPDDVDSATTTRPETDDQQASNEGEDQTAASTVAGVGGPLVGEPTGLGVIYGSQGFGRLKLLELDTGVLHELQATGDPLGLMGSSLVTRRSDSVSLYPLQSVDAEPMVINGRAGWVEVVSISDERIWTISGQPEPDGWEIVGYDETGEAVESIEMVSTFPYFGWDPAADLVQGEAGGVYRRDGDGYQRVSVGSLVAAGNEIALARECDERLDCGLNWYDKDDWDDPLDLPAPDMPAQGQATVSSNDRWLIATNWVTGTTELFDVQTGEMVRSVQAAGGPLENSIGLSPDGRWLIDPGFGNTMIVDLESGAEWPQDIRGEVAIFVDLALVDFAG